MTEFHFTRKAVEDLSSIWEYTVDMWPEQHADEYYWMLISSCRKVVTNLIVLGQKYEEVADDLFGFKTGRHILFYHIVANGDVEIIRILHERMDLKSQIGGI